MASTAIEIRLDGQAALRQRLELLPGMNLDPLRHNIGALVESQTRRRIHEEKAGPDGKAWAPWGPNWASSRHKGHGLLENDGDLLDSIHFVVAGGDILVGSDLVYAAIHQFGGAEVGMAIPERPYLGMSDENWGDVVDQADVFVNRVLH